MMRRPEAVIRLVAVVAIFALAFYQYFQTTVSLEASSPWIWVTLAALLVSAVLVARKLRVLAKVGTVWPKSAGWGVPLVLFGLATFIAGAYGGVTPSTGIWFRLLGSLLALTGLLWSAFGVSVARQMALPMLPLAFLVEPSFSVARQTLLLSRRAFESAINPAQTSLAAGAVTAITLAVIATQFRLSARGVFVVLASSVAAGLVVAEAQFALLPLAAAPLVLVMAFFGEEIRGREAAKCDVCGESYSARTVICQYCSRELLAKRASSNRAPLVLSLSLVLLSGIIAVPVAYSTPLGLNNYTTNGLTAVPYVVAPSGWKMTSQNVTTAGNVLSSSAIFVPGSVPGTRTAVNQTITLPNSGVLPAPSTSTFTLLARGSLNDTEGIGYSVINGTGSYSLVLGWSSLMTSRNSTGQSQVFASLTVESTFEGRFNRTDLAGALAGSTPLAESLVTRLSGFGTSSLYLYEGQIAFGFLGEYIATFAGAALIFGVALIGTRSDDKKEGMILGMRDLSQDEKAVLGSLSRGSYAILVDEAELAGWTRTRVYDTINTLLRRELVNIRLKVHSRFAGIKVSSAVGTN